MSYKVTDTREISTMTQAGTEVKVYRVWLATSRGSTGVVDVPVDKWNPDDLPPILEEKAAQLDLAFDLTGE